MTIKNFHGGLNTRVHPTLIDPAESVVYTNCDNEQGILKPVKGCVDSTYSANKYYEYFNAINEIISSDIETSFVEYKDTMYYTNALGMFKTTDNVTINNVGIEPSTIPLVSSELDFLTDGLVGSYQYVYSYYDIVNDIESSISDESAIINPTSGFIDISGFIASANTDITHIRLYRKGGTLPDYNRVDEFEISTTNYRDIKPDTYISTNPAPSSLYIVEPASSCSRYKTDVVSEGTGLVDDTYKYIYTYYDSVSLSESLPSPASSPYTLSTPAFYDYGIKVSSFVASPDTNVTNIRLYRYSNLHQEYRLVTTKANTTASYTDYIRDISGNSLLPTPVTLVRPLNILAGTIGLTGTYTYVYTYYNSVDGTESRPNPVSDDIIVTDIGIYVTGFTSSTDTQVTSIRLYRLGGSITQYTLVEELPFDTESYMDTSADYSISGNHILDSYNNYTPIVGLKYLIEAYAMLFAAYEDKLYFSDIAYPNNWNVTNFLDFDGEVTGIGAVQNGLIVFTRYKSYIVTGTSPDTFSKYLLSGEHGCVNNYSIQFINNTLIWLSANGLCSSNGGLIELITQPKLGRLELDSINSAVHNNVYYLSHDEGILVIDFRYGTCIRTLYIEEYNHGCRLLKFNNKLYVHSGTGYIALKEMLVGDPIPIVYTSPRYTIGRYSELKLFKDFYLSYSGILHLTIYLDDDIVLDKDLDTTKSSINIKSLGNRMGYGVQFTITGIGEVYEIDFTAGGRENGK